ncbi:MAG: UDP-N-acetylmuramoyl-tripeptide--D-alanyl-D-alanine ligase [Nitrospiraceae bacterium]|nr:MAG: UDP-N-acetylmuramoyl-tripeptide--D-alanyl-D-alanine ligase [Nitrospiraceae bacterium]
MLRYFFTKLTQNIRLRAMALTVDDIIMATGGEVLTKGPETFMGVSIDSRTIGDGEIFFAIKGERFDGHTFLNDALARGSGAVVGLRPESLPQGKAVILVKDTLKALQDLAYFKRMKLDIPVVAVTGSNGKTTTKEMAYAILSKRFRSLKNEGNLNNHIGLPLSLIRLDHDHEAVVLEMGMNALGEIRRLCDIAVPTHGIITNIGAAHLGRLGSYSAVRDAKLEILHGLNIAIVNADDRFLIEGIDEAETFNGDVITFSINNESQVRARGIESSDKGSSFVLELMEMGTIPVQLPVQGIFNVYNALAAAAAGYSLGVSPEEIKAALESFSPCSMRFTINKVDGITMIDDSYNANPSSMEASVKELIRMGSGGRSVAVLGDMRELDEFAEQAHRDLGKMIAEYGVNIFIAVGEMMSLAAEACISTKSTGSKTEVYSFRDSEEANRNIMDILKQGDIVLIKGSRSTHMDKVAARIRGR